MRIAHSDVEEEQRAFARVLATFQQYGPYSLAANNRRRKDIYTLPRGDQELLGSLGYKERLAEVDGAILANAQFLKQIVANPEIFGHQLEMGEDESEAEGGERAAHAEVGTAEPAETNTETQTQIGRSSGHSHVGGGRSHSHSHSHSHGGHSLDHGHGHSHNTARPTRLRPTDGDMDKLRSTMKQFVRDWSDEGRVERDACYKPMIDALLEHFKAVPESERSKLRVLVPGAGLCRLAWDVAKLGFVCQGNEFSHYMLLASFFILNRTDEVNQHTIYPYVHSFSNIREKSDVLRPISFPDVSPASLPPDSNFSLIAGDFEEIYGAEDDETDEPQAGLWDAIMTCFFIDTAKNIVNYLRIIHRKLAPGGVWINLGPLLWHWENNTSNDPSVELTLEEVKALARGIGFDISNEKTIETTYTNNAQSMLGYEYKTSFWTATKIE